MHSLAYQVTLGMQVKTQWYAKVVQEHLNVYRVASNLFEGYRKHNTKQLANRVQLKMNRFVQQGYQRRTQMLELQQNSGRTKSNSRAQFRSKQQFPQQKQYRQSFQNKSSQQFKLRSTIIDPDLVISEEAASYDDMVNYLRKGCKPKENFRIGVEHEKLGVNRKDLSRVNYSQIRDIFGKLQQRFGWQPIYEDGKLIALTQNKQSISIEPGGQFELSGAPLETLHQACQETNTHLYQLKSIIRDMDIEFLGVGFDPKHELDEIPIMPKERYHIMRKYMPKVGSLGLDMMLRSCTIQVNLDFGSEQDMIDKFRIGLDLQLVCTALFANSPFRNGKYTGYQSWRSHIWEDTDNNRTGMLPFVFDKNFGFESYANYAMDVPMYFVNRNEKFIDCTGQSFREFMKGKLPQLPGQKPTMSDWAAHLTTIFPEVRLKKFLEMRGADGGPWNMICALAAFWVGLLYDDKAIQECLELTQDFTQPDRDYLRQEVPIHGLKTKFKGKTVQELAQRVLEISKGGLQRRGLDEERFLGSVETIATTGKTQSDYLINYIDKNQNDFSKVIDYSSY